MTALRRRFAELKKSTRTTGRRSTKDHEAVQGNGANPLAGAFRCRAKLPVFFALFGVLRAIAEDKPSYAPDPRR